MDAPDPRALRFAELRPHLWSVAFRMLGSTGEADDAVQEAWLRLDRSDVSAVENLGGWLTTVVARVCLDLLRARKARSEEPLGAVPPEPEDRGDERPSPEQALLLAQSLGPALLVLLETLDPAERVAFVLHDVFDLSFEEIGPIVGRSEVAARQLASRARRRIRGASPNAAADDARRRQLVNAFLAASRDGDLEALLAALAPDAVLRADGLAVQTASANRWGGTPLVASGIRGAPAVAEALKGRARGTRPALIDGEPGAVWSVGGQVRSAFVFTVRADGITGIEILMEPERLAGLDIEVVTDGDSGP